MTKMHQKVSLSREMLRSESEIMARWGGNIDKPVLSVQCIAYNHEGFIEDAIKGILIQQTSFPIEVWIHDDASTDGTRGIIETYQSKYPRIIKTVLQASNQYSKGIKPGALLLDRCIGKYIAVCQGDDFWIDELKLQKQVDYLEVNPNCVISCHDAFIIDASGKVLSESKLPKVCKRDHSSEELLEGRAFLLTLSWVYRNVLKHYPQECNFVVNFDTFLISLLGKFGGSHFHNDIRPAAYRVHSGGIWSSIDSNARRDEMINTMYMMHRYYFRVGQSDIADALYKRFERLAVQKAPIALMLKDIAARLSGGRFAGKMRQHFSKA